MAKHATPDKTRNSRPPSRAAVAAALTALAIGFVAVRFFVAAHETLSRTRENACRAFVPDPVPAALMGREAPDFTLSDAAGRKVSLSAQKGHPVAVNFWATWCEPCRREIPLCFRLQQLHLRGNVAGPEGLRVL